jgi:hypothetical protein
VALAGKAEADKRLRACVGRHDESEHSARVGSLSWTWFREQATAQTADLCH